MKFIDEKGKLFGKINIIDFMVVMTALILFFFLFLYPIYNKYKSRNSSVVDQQSVKGESLKQQEKEFIDVLIECLFIKLDSHIVEMVEVKDKNVDSDGVVMGEILSLGEITPYMRHINIGERQEVVYKDSGLKQRSVVLKLKVELKDGCIFYNGQHIAENSIFEFKTANYSVQARFISLVDSMPTDFAANMGSDTYFEILERRIASLEEKLDSYISKSKKKINAIEDKIKEDANEEKRNEDERKRKRKR